MHRLLLAALCLCATVPARADLIVGHAGTFDANLDPFSNGYTGEYQQVYSALAFSAVPGGRLTITALSFGTGSLGNYGPAIPQTLTFTLSLSTTSVTPHSISTNFAANRGADFVQVFSGTLSYTPSRTFTTDFTIPTSTFVYDSSRGNLLIDFNISSGAGGNVPGNPMLNGFASDTSGALIGRAYLQEDITAPGGIPATDATGLVTEFGATRGANLLGVPEPSTVVLMGMGFILLTAYANVGRLRQSNQSLWSPGSP